MLDRPNYHLNTVDFLLADVALRIQLRPTQFKRATQRYQAIADWLERDDSPLKGHINELYAQGSMSIGATIWSRMDEEDYDIDVMVELDLPPNTPAHIVLDLLYHAVRGQPGSRYYDKTERRTRCVTVQYEDMHLDLTPTIRTPERPALTGWIFHHKKNVKESRYLANPWGFAQWYIENTPNDNEFADLVLRLAESRYPDEYSITAKADAQPVPDHEPITSKSKALLAHQLMKRWRNNRYSNRKGLRRPPSPLMACINARNAGVTLSLGEELEFQVRMLLKVFEEAHTSGRLVNVRNPRCDEDDFTDRWPANLDEQALFISDLRDFQVKAARIMDEDCDLSEMQSIMADLFGEKPTLTAFEDYADHVGDAVKSGEIAVDDRGRVNLTGSGIAGAASVITGSKAASSQTAPKHKFYGKPFKRR